MRHKWQWRGVFRKSAIATCNTCGVKRKPKGKLICFTWPSGDEVCLKTVPSCPGFYQFKPDGKLEDERFKTAWQVVKDKLGFIVSEEITEVLIAGLHRKDGAPLIPKGFYEEFRVDCTFNGRKFENVFFKLEAASKHLDLAKNDADKPPVLMYRVVMEWKEWKGAKK